MNLIVLTTRWLGLVAWLVCPLAALAYRPFIATDAAVADKGVSEVELGIVDFARKDSATTIAVPDLRYNYGFATNWEVVAEGAMQVYDSGSNHGLELLGPQLSLKGVFLEGPLQEGRRPVSLALEIGALLPETAGGSGFGFQGVLIGSWRAGKFTFHANAGGGIGRESSEPMALWGLIVERPILRDLRIAAELDGQSARGSTPDNSALVGLLWDQHRITYDAGIRFGLTKAAPDVAFTMGLTFRF